MNIACVFSIDRNLSGMFIMNAPLQTLYRMFIINAGPGFKMGLKAVKSFLDSKTASKINVSSKSLYNLDFY